MAYRVVRVLAVVSALTLSGQGTAQSGFLGEQLKYSRVRAARAEKDAVLREMFRAKKLSFPPRAILIRVFKQEGELEVWAGADPAGPLSLLRSYRVCASSGVLGPKRREGDHQVPEGFYEVDRFNPVSQFHLSLGINYPNAVDRILGKGPRLGGDIFIHGNCVTLGCVPITDEGIQELYWLAVLARSKGQRRVPVHLFPFRMSDGRVRSAATQYLAEPESWSFWMNLKEGYDLFEKTRRIPEVTSDGQGRYRFRE